MLIFNTCHLCSTSRWTALCRRLKSSDIQNFRKLIKYHNISYSVPNMILRNVAVQTVFRIVSAVTIPKTSCGIEYDILWYVIV